MHLLNRSISRPLAAAFVSCIALYAATIVAKPDAFFADDSYFYLQVAWNFAHYAS